MWMVGSSAGAVPAGGYALWRGLRTPWIVGDPAETAARVVRDDASGVRLAVVGPCYASENQLRAGLVAAKNGQWRELTHWPGSYWVVVQDRSRTAVVTDVAGTRPVYYATAGLGHTVWATTATPLASLVGAPIDHDALIARLACPTVPEVVGDRSAFLGVRRLPGGHALLIDPTSPISATAVRYETQDTIATAAEAAEALRAALITAVNSRARSTARLTADFSGGLDSTSLALLAAHDGHEVFAVTHEDAASPNDDVSYARQAAATTPRIRHHVVNSADDALFFDRLDAAPPTDQPYSDAARWSMRRAFQQVAMDHGTDLHLTGSGGDARWPRTRPTSPISPASGAIDCSAEHARAHARLRHLPVRTVIAGALRLAGMTHEDALDQLAEEFTRPSRQRLAGSGALRWYGAAGFTAWLTPDARLRMAVAFGATTPGPVVPREVISTHRAWSEVREFGGYQTELTGQLNATGLNAHAPFLDNAVVRACLSVPTHEAAIPTVQKPSLGTALRGLVPEFILTRRTKGALDANAHAGLRRNLPMIRPALRPVGTRRRRAGRPRRRAGRP